MCWSICGVLDVDTAVTGEEKQTSADEGITTHLVST